MKRVWGKLNWTIKSLSLRSYVCDHAETHSRFKLAFHWNVTIRYGKEKVNSDHHLHWFGSLWAVCWVKGRGSLGGPSRLYVSAGSSGLGCGSPPSGMDWTDWSGHWGEHTFLKKGHKTILIHKHWNQAGLSSNQSDDTQTSRYNGFFSPLVCAITQDMKRPVRWPQHTVSECWVQQQTTE